MKKKTEHTGFRNGDLFCFNCGTAYKMNLPQPVSMASAMMKQFAKDHKNCAKTWVQPVMGTDERTERQKAEWWLQNGERGVSSETMFHYLSDQKIRIGKYESTPSDPDDFKRCSKLLEAVPEWRSKLHLLKPVSPVWEKLVDNWDKLEEMFIEAKKLWAQNKGASEMYEFMKSLGC
jgi:hypothetical protein